MVCSSISDTAGTSTYLTSTNRSVIACCDLRQRYRDESNQRWANKTACYLQRSLRQEVIGKPLGKRQRRYRRRRRVAITTEWDQRRNVTCLFLGLVTHSFLTIHTFRVLSTHCRWYRGDCSVLPSKCKHADELTQL